MKNLLISALFSILCLTAFGQSLKKNLKGRPNLPGTFLIEIGVNRNLNSADTFNIGFWGSRSLNLYYQHDFKIPILKGKFSFHPGIGLAMERFKFKDLKTIGYDATGALQIINPRAGTTKSQLIANYLDIPMELRFSTNPFDPNRSFKAAVGFRAGVLLNGQTKLKYENDGDTIKEKNRQAWNLNNIRYGVYGRIGVGNVNLFGYYNLSTYFKEGEGIQGKDINVLTVGLSIGGF